MFEGNAIFNQMEIVVLGKNTEDILKCILVLVYFSCVLYS